MSDAERFAHSFPVIELLGLGITRDRQMKRSRAQILTDRDDVDTEVREVSLTMADVMAADEVFTTGNYVKVIPIIRVEERDLQPGPVTKQARALYFEFAKTTSVFD